MCWHVYTGCWQVEFCLFWSCYEMMMMITVARANDDGVDDDDYHSVGLLPYKYRYL